MRRDRRPRVITALGGGQRIPGRFLAGARGFTALELVLAASISLIILFAIYTVLESTRGTYDAGESRADIQQQARVAIERMARELRLVGYGFPVLDPPPLSTDPEPDCNGDGFADTAILAATATSVTFCADVMNASTTLTADVAAGNGNMNVVDASGIRGKGKGKGKGAVGDSIFLMAGATWDQMEVNAVNTTANPHIVTVGGGGVPNDYSWGISVGRPKPITYCWNDSNGVPGSPNCGSDANTLYQDEGEGGGFQLLADSIQTFQLEYFDGTDAEILPADLAANLANIRRVRITMVMQSAEGWLGTQSFSIYSNARMRNM